MEKMTVVGKQKLDFTNRKGEQIKGIKLHCLSTNANVDGQAVETIFCNERATAMCDVARSVNVGGTIEVSFNRWGKAETVQACK